jgi:hypothetical protein
MRRLYYVLPLAALALCAVLWAGWTLPHRHIETGLDDYRGIERRYAETAVELTKVQNNEWGNPAPPIAAYRVTDVRRCPERPIRCGPAIRVREGVYRENPECEGSPFAVDVQTYTLFGVPFGSADLPCEGRDPAYGLPRKPLLLTSVNRRRRTYTRAEAPGVRGGDCGARASA